MLTGPELPAAFAYLSNDDNLRLRVRNSAAACVVELAGRYRAPDGTVIPFVDTIAPAVDRSASTKLIRMSEGVLLNVSVRALAGTPRRGQTFVLVELVRGLTGDVQPLGILVQGYVSDTTRRQWPGSLLEDSTDGRGCLRSVTGTNPAAGAEIVEMVPTAVRWRLLSITYQLTTDATAANRRSILQLDDGATVFGRFSPPAVQAASLVHLYEWAAVGASLSTFTEAEHGLFPADVSVFAGCRIRTSTPNLQAADDYSAPQLLVEEWIEP